jgi:hypothetical protein
MATVIIIGMILGVVVAVLQVAVRGSIKLFLPRRMHAGFEQSYDNGADAIGRLVGRILILGFLGFVIFMIWLINFGGA